MGLLLRLGFLGVLVVFPNGRDRWLCRCPIVLPLRDDPGYTILIEPLSMEHGGGYIATVSDLPGCMSDGETREEAAHHVGDAIRAWMKAAQELGRVIPQPARLALAAGE